MRFAKKSLGQNFLVDANYQRKIIQAVRSLYDGETVIEIGPGRGALTQHLEPFARELILVEKDRQLASELEEKWESGCVKVVNADFLKWDLRDLAPRPHMVVANLPYNVSTQILIRLLKAMQRFSALFLMFQKEVALRCAAKEDSSDFGILSVWAQTFARVEKLFDVPPTAFRPQPKIISTVLKFTPAQTLYDTSQQEFIDFVKLIFSQRRKKISSILKKKPKFAAKADHEKDVVAMMDSRAEALSIAKMRVLFEALKSPKAR